MTEWATPMLHLLERRANHRENLLVGRSSISGMGLFTTATIPRDAAIGVWSGRRLDPASQEIDEYAMEISLKPYPNVVITPKSIEGVVDYAQHPLAALNEPPVKQIANVYPRVEDHDDGQGRSIALVVFYAARTIRTDQELTWHYGPTYKRHYPVGRAAKVRDPPYNARRVERVLESSRTDILVYLDEVYSSQSGESSESEASRV